MFQLLKMQIVNQCSQFQMKLMNWLEKHVMVNLAPDEMKGASCTITNIGSAGGQWFTPVINHPEVAILGIGRIAEKPVVKNGEIVAAPVLALSLSFDHRMIDGATAQHALKSHQAFVERSRTINNGGVIKW